jgi:hypothetical protein
MVVIHKKKCIFVHIPKCAGTSMEQFLKLYSQIMTDDGMLIIQDIHVDLMSLIGSCRNKR